MVINVMFSWKFFSSFLYIMSIFVYIFWLKVGGVWEWVHLLCFGYYSEDHLHPCTLSLLYFRAEMNLVKAADSWLYVFLIHTDSMCFRRVQKHVHLGWLLINEELVMSFHFFWLLYISISVSVTLFIYFYFFNFFL